MWRTTSLQINDWDYKTGDLVACRVSLWSRSRERRGRPG